MGEVFPEAPGNQRTAQAPVEDLRSLCTTFVKQARTTSPIRCAWLVLRFREAPTVYPVIRWLDDVAGGAL